MEKIGNTIKSALSNIMSFFAGMIFGVLLFTGVRDATSIAIFVSVALISLAFHISVKD